MSRAALCATRRLGSSRDRFYFLTLRCFLPWFTLDIDRLFVIYLILYPLDRSEHAMAARLLILLVRTCPYFSSDFSAVVVMWCDNLHSHNVYDRLSLLSRSWWVHSSTSPRPTLTCWSPSVWRIIQTNGTSPALILTQHSRVTPPLVFTACQTVVWADCTRPFSDDTYVGCLLRFLHRILDSQTYSSGLVSSIGNLSELVNLYAWQFVVVAHLWFPSWTARYLMEK